MPGVLMELEMRSVDPGDMKSVIVDEMSILWSAIRSSAEQTEADLSDYGGGNKCVFKHTNYQLIIRIWASIFIGFPNLSQSISVRIKKIMITVEISVVWWVSGRSWRIWKTTILRGTCEKNKQSKTWILFHKSLIELLTREDLMKSHSPQMFITASVLKSSPSIHSWALNCGHTKHKQTLNKHSDPCGKHNTV